MKYVDITRAFREKQINLFTTQDFEQLTGLNRTSAWATLGRYCHKGWLESPKRGLYYFVDNPPDEFLLANKLYVPSYVSFETALAYYSVIPETVYSIISATTKVTREFKDGGKRFRYLKIKQPAYTGYIKKDNYLIAEPEKALVDYLYFVVLRKKEINDRVDTTKTDKNKLKKYARLFSNLKLTQMVERLC